MNTTIQVGNPQEVSPSDEEWATRVKKAVHTTEDWNELRRKIRDIEKDRAQREHRDRRPRVGFVGELGLPVEVKAHSNSGNVTHFAIIEPRWVDMHSKVMDTLASTGFVSRSPYEACSVVVSREQMGREEVMLSKRLTGYGKGTYTLPGGKRRPGESLEECAIRELKEETGLELPGKPPDFSASHEIPRQTAGTLYRGAGRTLRGNIGSS